MDPDEGWSGPPQRGGRRAGPGRLVVILAAAVVTMLLVASALALSGMFPGGNPAAATDPPPTLTPADTPAAVRTPQPTAPEPEPDPDPQQFEIVTHPEGAAVEITTSAGTTHTGKTPFSGMVEGGPIEVSISHDGFNTLTEQVVLDRDLAVEWWLDPAGLLHHKVREFSTGAAPKQVAFSPDGRQLWTSLLGGTGLDVFNPLTGERLAQIDLGEHGAVEVIFTEDGSTVFASQMESASVFEIDVQTFAVRRQMPTGGSWSKVMALSPDESTLYVSNWSSNDVSEIDLATGEVRRLLPTVATPRGLYPTVDGERLYVAGFENGDLERINLADGTSETLMTTGGALRHLVGDDEAGLLFANDMATNEVFVLDLNSEAIRKLADTNNKPNTTDLTADAKILYVSNRGANNPQSYYIPGPEWGSVLAIDTRSGTILDGIVGGNQTTALDVSDDGQYLAFSDFLDDRIQVFAIPSSDALINGGGGRAQTHLAELAK
jgi:YVTN family beta-propeller protein